MWPLLAIGAALLLMNRKRTRRNPQRTRRRGLTDAQRRSLNKLPPTARTEALKDAADFETFHGRAPRVRRVRFRAPTSGILLGTLDGFSYIAPADSERGKTESGKRVVWTHEAGDLGLGPIRMPKTAKVYIARDGTLFTVGGHQKLDPKRGVIA